jgi:hypothetical protein
VDGALVGAGSRRPKLHTNKQGECHTVALPFTLKKYYLKAKEELWKLKYFTMQKYKSSKKSSKKNQNPSQYYNSIRTNHHF